MKTEIVQSIETKIYTVRGKKVILDRDLGILYEVTTKRLNEQFKRNLNRFPPDFAFVLLEEELKSLRSQNATLELSKFTYLPVVFTELGVLMLANILKSEVAKNVSIEIIRVFVRLKEQAYLNDLLKSKIQFLENISLHNHKDIKRIFEILNQLMSESAMVHPEDRKRIGFTVPKKNKNS